MREEYTFYDNERYYNSAYGTYDVYNSQGDLIIRTKLPDAPKKKTTKQILDSLDFKEIEQYVRQKKLQNIDKK